MQHLFLLFTSVLLLFCFPNKLHAQVSTIIRTRGTDISNEMKLRQEFVNRMDSLFVNGQYYAMIEVYNSSYPTSFQEDADYNLIAALFFLGNIERYLLHINRKKNRYTTAEGAVQLLLNTSTAYRTFIAIPRNQEHILGYIHNNLVKEKVNNYSIAKQLLDLYIADQTLITNSRTYNEKNSKSNFPYNNLLADSVSTSMIDSIQLQIFRLYKQEGKFFSKDEVGSLAFVQIVLFLQEKNLQRREYFLTLIQDAVKNGELSVEKEMDFRIHTEIIESGTGAIFPSQELEDKYRKLYNKPNYFYLPL